MRSDCAQVRSSVSGSRFLFRLTKGVSFRAIQGGRGLEFWLALGFQECFSRLD